MTLSLLAALVLPPFAMLYAEQVKAEGMPPCHMQMTQQDHSDSPCGQDFAHCKCCVVNAAILAEVVGMPQERYAPVQAVALAAFMEYQPELSVPPPRFI